MNKLDPETLAAIIVLGIIGVGAVFREVPPGSALLVTAVVSGLTGWIARGEKTAAKPDAAEDLPRRPALFSDNDLDIPPAPPAQ